MLSRFSAVIGSRRLLRSNFGNPKHNPRRRDATPAQVLTGVSIVASPRLPFPPPSRGPVTVTMFLLRTVNEILYRDNGRIMSAASTQARDSCGRNPRISVPARTYRYKMIMDCAVRINERTAEFLMRFEIQSELDRDPTSSVSVSGLRLR